MTRALKLKIELLIKSLLIISIFLTFSFVPNQALADEVPCQAKINFQASPTTVNPDQTVNISGTIQSLAFTPKESQFGPGLGWCRIFVSDGSSSSMEISSIFWVVVTNNQSLSQDVPSSSLLNNPPAGTFIKASPIKLNQFDNTTQYPFNFSLTPNSNNISPGTFQLYATVFGTTQQNLSQTGSVAKLTEACITDACSTRITVKAPTVAEPPPKTNPPPGNVPSNKPPSAGGTPPLIINSTGSNNGLVPCGGNEQSFAEQISKAPKQTKEQLDALFAQYQEHSCNIHYIFVLFARVVNAMVGLAGIYAIYRIVFVSFGLVESWGSEESIKAGKEGITNAILGFMLVLAAYLLVNTIFGIFAPQFGSVANNGFLFNPFAPK